MDTIKTIADLSKLSGSVRNVTVSLTPSEQRLIAAAPELLEALIDVKMLLNGDATNFDMLRDDVLNHVSRLIAKATGGNK